MKGWTITKGKEVLKTYTDNSPDSGTPLSRVFCGDCGSNLWALTPTREDVVTIAAGTLDDYRTFSPEIEWYCPQRASFVNKMVADKERRFIAGPSRMSETEDE